MKEHGKQINKGTQRNSRSCLPKLTLSGGAVGKVYKFRLLITGRPVDKVKAYQLKNHFWDETDKSNSFGLRNTEKFKFR